VEATAQSHHDALPAISGIFALVALIPAIIVYIKRFNDRNKSGWSLSSERLFSQHHMSINLTGCTEFCTGDQDRDLSYRFR
jgi:hypothetical protein